MSSKSRQVKFNELRNGITIYAPYTYEVRKYRVKSRPFLFNSFWAIEVYNDKDVIFLGEGFGYRGHTKLYWNRKSAEQELVRQQQMRERVLELDEDPSEPFDWPSYDDYDDTDYAARYNQQLLAEFQALTQGENSEFVNRRCREIQTPYDSSQTRCYVRVGTNLVCAVKMNEGRLRVDGVYDEALQTIMDVPNKFLLLVDGLWRFADTDQMDIWFHPSSPSNKKLKKQLVELDHVWQQALAGEVWVPKSELSQALNGLFPQPTEVVED